MRQHKTEFDAIPARVVAISFGPASQAMAFLEQTQWPWELLVDRKREAYAAYGVQRTVTRLATVATLRREVEMRRRGDTSGGLRGDPFQLGADFVVDARGILRYAHANRGLTDSSEAEELLGVLRTLAASAVPS